MRNNTTSSRIKNITLGQRVLARTDTFYFLEFVEYSSDIFEANSNISSKPSLIFYTKDAEQHVILDYSMAKAEDKLYLQSFFAGENPGITFEFTNGEYLDELKGVEANLSGIFEFEEFKTNMVFCKVDSINNLNTALNLYSSYYLINTPQLIKAGQLQETEKTQIPALVFSNPRTANPLLRLGYQPGDYIQILNPNSQNNYKSFKINDVLFINGKEILKLQPEYKDQIITENLTGQNTIVNLLVESKIQVDINNFSNDQINLGCCINSTLNVALPNHTELQCACRGNSFVFDSGSCYGSLSNMIQPITGDPVTTTQDLQFLSDPLSQAMKTVLNPDYLETLYKKKIVTVDTSGLVINENNNLVVDYRANVIPILQSSIENIAAIKAEQELSGTSVLTQVPKGLIQSFTELDGITLVPDSPIYKILNIFYETYLTDNSVITKALGGIPLVSNCIYLHKNVLTTFFETNVSSNQADRILFSHNKDILMPVINFREHGYDYLQLGRYHIITPIQDEPTPLYIFSTSGLKSEQSICGIGPAKTISTIDQSKKILEPGSTNVINTLGYYNTNLVNFVSNTYGA